MTAPKKNWQQLVLERAIEISVNGVPEEGDFNTAMIQLRDEIPAEEMALLQKDLEAVEVGSSFQYAYEEIEEDTAYWNDWYDEGCPDCGNPLDFCDCWLD